MEYLPSEGLTFKNKPTPEMRLWARMVRIAVYDLSDPERRAAALDWFWSDRVGVGSFLFVADVLGFEAGYLRRLVKQRVRGGACSGKQLD